MYPWARHWKLKHPCKTSQHPTVLFVLGQLPGVNVCNYTKSEARCCCKRACILSNTFPKINKSLKGSCLSETKWVRLILSQFVFNFSRVQRDLFWINGKTHAGVYIWLFVKIIHLSLSTASTQTLQPQLCIVHCEPSLQMFTRAGLRR